MAGIAASKGTLQLSGAVMALALVALAGFSRVSRGRSTVLYNQWGTNDHNEHWGGVGSENYHTKKWDNTGSNANYHPRDSSSADGDSMEPAWWRQGPGANSEYTGHAMDGDIFNPPDVPIFKPFNMKGTKQQLFDVDGPSPYDPPRAAWARGGKGTTAWMLEKEGPLLASQQGPLPVARKAVMRQTLRAAPHPPVRFYDADGPSPKDPPRASWARGGKGTSEYMLEKEAKEGKLVAQQQGPLVRASKVQKNQKAAAKKASAPVAASAKKAAPAAAARKQHAAPKAVKRTK